ncbi:hypothetical protein BKA80DRAFT_2153 [Phyllosticta citrichinensis]
MEHIASPFNHPVLELHALCVYDLALTCPLMLTNPSNRPLSVSFTKLLHPLYHFSYTSYPLLPHWPARLTAAKCLSHRPSARSITVVPDPQPASFGVPCASISSWPGRAARADREPTNGFGSPLHQHSTVLPRHRHGGGGNGGVQTIPRSVVGWSGVRRRRRAKLDSVCAAHVTPSYLSDPPHTRTPFARLDRGPPT